MENQVFEPSSIPDSRSFSRCGQDNEQENRIKPERGIKAETSVFFCMTTFSSRVSIVLQRNFQYFFDSRICKKAYNAL